MSDLVVPILVTIAGIVLSALFSGLETGLYTINRVRLAVRAGQGDPRAQRIRSLLARPAVMLSTLLVGNNVANYAGSFGIAAILDRQGVAPVHAVAINAGILIPLLFVFGETLPKDLFRTHTDTWSYRLSGFLIAVRNLLTWIGLNPVVQGFARLVARMLGAAGSLDLSARQRMSRLIKEGLGAGVLSESQASLVDRALALRNLAIETEMIAMSRADTIPLDVTRDQIRDLTVERNRTRLPVVDRSGQVVGIIAVVDALMQPDVSARELMTPPLELAAGTSVREAIERIRRERRKMAIVVHEGRPVGLVTLKDLVEPLTGELTAW